MAKIKFTLIDVKNVTGSKYKAILYIPPKGNILVELPKSGIVKSIDPYEISNYISVKTINTSWIKLHDNSLIKLDNGNIYHVINISNIIRPTISIKLNCDLNIISKLKQFENDDFIVNENNRIISFRSIFYPLICEMQTYSEKCHIEKIMMVVKNNVYVIPFGNTYSTGQICFGDQPNSFESISKEQILGMFLSSYFKEDSQFCIKNTSKECDLILNCEQIDKNIQENIKIHPYDIFYYISQNEITEEFLEKILYRCIFELPLTTTWDAMINV